MPPFLTTLTAKLVAVAALSLALLTAGAYGGYRWELGKYETLVAAQAQAVTAATQVAMAKQATIDKANQKVAQVDQKVQTQIVTHTITVTQEIPTYVHDQISCPSITVGLARVLRAASQGVDPASLDLAAGQLDDQCSDVTASEVAGWFTSYAGAAQANSAQLNALIDSVKSNQAIVSDTSDNVAGTVQ